MKRLLVTGSREWKDELVVAREVYAAWRELSPHTLPGLTTLVHGGATGADTIAGRFAHCWGWPVEVHAADWNRYGKRAGYVRNAEMVNLGADLCVAFILDGSKGATMCADLAEKAGIPVRRIEATSPPAPASSSDRRQQHG